MRVEVIVHKSGLSWTAYLALIPELVKLIASTVAALKDGKVSPAEVQEIGQELVALVAHAMA